VRRVLLVSMLIVIIAPMLAWLLLPRYSPWLLNTVLADSGFQFVGLDVERVGWRHLVLNKATLRSDGGAVLNIDGVEVYKLDQSTAFDISIAAVTLDLSKLGLSNATTGSSPTPAHSQQLLSSFLPSRLLEMVPSVKLELESFQILGQHPLDEFFVMAEHIHVESTSDSTELQSVVTFNSGDQRHKVALVASMRRNNIVQFTVSHVNAESPLVSLKAEIKPAAQSLGVNVDMDIGQGKSASLMAELKGTKRMMAVEGRAQFEFDVADQGVEQFFSEPQLTLLGETHAKVNDIQGGGTAAMAAAFQLDLDTTDWYFSLRHASDSPLPLLQLAATIEGVKHEFLVLIAHQLGFSGPVKGWPNLLKDLQMAHRNSLLARYSVNDKIVMSSEFNDLQWNGVLPLQPGFQFQTKAVTRASFAPLMEGLTKTSPIDPAMAETRFELEQGTAILPTQLTFNNTSVDIVIGHQAQLAAQALKGGDGLLERPVLGFAEQTVSIGYALNHVDPVDFELVADSWQTPTYRLYPLYLQGSVGYENGQYNVELESRAISAQKTHQGLPYVLPPISLNAEIRSALPSMTTQSAVTQAISGESMEVISEGLAIDVDFELFNECHATLLRGTLLQSRYLNLHVSQRFTENSTLKSWLNLGQLSNDIVRGKLEMLAKWDLAEYTLPLLELHFNDGRFAGDLGSMNAVQLSLSTLKAESGFEYMVEGGVQHMNIGAELTDFHYSAKLLPKAGSMGVAISQLDAAIFGGHVRVRDEFWQAGQDEEILLTLEDVDLAEVVETQHVSGLFTSGTLSGVQPIQISSEGAVSLLKGNLSSTEAGVIRYHSSLSDSSDFGEELKLTMEVLKNFQYDTLKTETEYRDGNLVLRSAIAGSNPDVAGGQKVNLNLNTEVGLNSSLQAMRLQAGLAAKIEKLFNPNTTISSMAYCQQSY